MYGREIVMIFHIMILVFLSEVVSASPPIQWVPESGGVVYTSKKECEKNHEGDLCLEQSKCPLFRCSPQDVEVEAGIRPVLKSEVACENEKACSDLIQADDFCSDPRFQKAWGDRNEDGELEAWCFNREMTYRTVKRLRPDANKIAELEAEEDREQQKRLRLRSVKDTVKLCARAQDLNANQIKACVQAVSKALIYVELELNEL